MLLILSRNTNAEKKEVMLGWPDVTFLFCTERIAFSSFYCYFCDTLKINQKMIFKILNY